jgi:acyl carrier protein
MADTKSMIRQYILAELIKDKKQANLKDSDSLIESGIVDSLGIMKLIGFLEDKVNIQISDDELIPENFSSVDSIAALVHKKQNN